MPLPTKLCHIGPSSLLKGRMGPQKPVVIEGMCHPFAAHATVSSHGSHQGAALLVESIVASSSGCMLH